MICTRRIPLWSTSTRVDARARHPWRPDVSTVREYYKRVVLDPDVRFGKPVVRGTRITVGDVLGYLASGMTEDDVLVDFPPLTRADVRACRAFAADRERRSVSLSATRTVFRVTVLASALLPSIPRVDVA